MAAPVRIDTPEQLQALARRPGVPALRPELFVRQRTDAHWIIPSKEGRVAARCSLWWSSAPELPPHRLGCIGHFAATDAPSAQDLLRHAIHELASRGCTLAVGPMDGSTWRPYRFITERGTRPPFFLEPDHPEDWRRYFEAAGFQPIATYCSMLDSDLSRKDPRLGRVERRLQEDGIAIRAGRADRFEEDLRKIYAAAVVSFRNNRFFTSIPEDEFVAQQLEIRPLIETDLVLLAEAPEGAVAGFVFALPDQLQLRREGRVDTLVVKTVGIRPGARYGGLGKLLLQKVLETARGRGYRRAIRALMHDSNYSRNWGGADSRVIRRYALFARSLRA